IAMRCSMGESARITTACPCSRRKLTGARSRRSSPAAIRDSSSARTARHARGAKEAACGCAGVFSAPAAIELYAEAFESMGALERLEGFAADFGADFYDLPRNQERITLVKESWEVPACYPFGKESIVPLRAGERVAWRIAPQARADEPG